MCVLIYNNGVRLSCFRATNHVTLSQIGPFGYYHYSQSLKRIYVFLCGKVLMSQTKFHIHSHEYGKKTDTTEKKNVFQELRLSVCRFCFSFYYFVFSLPLLLVYFLLLLLFRLLRGRDRIRITLEFERDNNILNNDDG